MWPGPVDEIVDGEADRRRRDIGLPAAPHDNAPPIRVRATARDARLWRRRSCSLALVLFLGHH